MSGPGGSIRCGGCYLARRLARRQEFMAACLDPIGATPRCVLASQERDQGGRKGESGYSLLTLGRRCSRGRLDVDVHSGKVVVHGSSAPSAPAPRTRTTLPLCMAAPVLAAPALVTDGLRLPRCVATQRLPSSCLSPFPSSFLACGLIGRSGRPIGCAHAGAVGENVGDGEIGKYDRWDLLVSERRKRKAAVG
jgi:hypothetical protein